MQCQGFKKYHLGQWSEQEFNEHAKTCPLCRKAEEKDRALLDWTRTLKTDIQAPALWPRIESYVRSDRNRPVRFMRTSGWGLHPVFRLAAVLLLGVGLGFLMKSEFLSKQPGLLADSAIRRVEHYEQAYESAISDLENGAQQQLTMMEFERMLLYRDRLETIDSQIRDCKHELARNPANAHIRRYLLAALKDKKETLTEIIHWKPHTGPV